MAAVPISDSYDKGGAATNLFRRKSLSVDLDIDRRFVDWRKIFLAIALMSAPFPTKAQKQEFINLISPSEQNPLSQL